MLPTEQELLVQIHQDFPESRWRRFEELIRLRQQERITEEELDELKQMTAEGEHRAVDRLQALSDLAQLRGTTLTDLMDQLGIKPRPFL